MTAWVVLAITLSAVSTPSTSPKKPDHKLNFAFRYAEQGGTELNTYKNTLTKDLVAARDTTIHFLLPKADSDSIYAEMIKIHFFDMKEPRPDMPNPCVGPDPGTSILIEATRDQDTKRISWSSDRVPCEEMTTDWAGLYELLSMLRRVMNRQPEYKSLPRPLGGYY